MRKHIKKKFRIEVKLEEEYEKELDKVFEFVPWSESSQVKISKEQFALLQTESGYLIGAFPYKGNNGKIWIPEPDPILIYFHSAYLSYRHIYETKTKVLKMLRADCLTDDILTELYNFFGLTTGFVISLFTSLEAFINNKIPVDFEYSFNTPNGLDKYTKQQIERYCSFEDKITKVFKQVTKKNFITAYPLKYQRIGNLKRFRDRIVHTKTDFSGHTPYDHIFKEALRFDYTSTLNAVADFINYHESGFIEECPCKNEW